MFIPHINSSSERLTVYFSTGNHADWEKRCVRNKNYLYSVIQKIVYSACKRRNIRNTSEYATRVLALNIFSISSLSTCVTEE